MERERHSVCSHSTLGWGRRDFFQVTKLGQIKGSEWRGREESGAVLERISSKNRVHKEGRESAVAGSL